MRYNYSYVMMDTIQFERYQKQCKRDGISCNYNQVGTDCYGVMVANEKMDGNIEKVQEVEKC